MVAATSGGASVQGESDPIRVDLRTGTRTAAETESITYSTEWVEGAGEGAVAVVLVDGVTISEKTGSGTVEWTPSKNGTYELTHKVMVGGEQVSDTLTATFSVRGLPEITAVTAQQRYPWNGKVDISYTVENAGAEARELSVWAVDQTTGITNVAKNVTGDVAYTNGLHHVVWDMSADGLTLVSSNVIFGVSYVLPPPLYCVIDLSDGTSASSYPVTYLDAVPSGGWSDEYKTSKLVLRRIKAGTFTMGSPTGEVGRYDDETQHQVTLTKDYYMGVFQVTQRQWELVMGARPSYFNNDTYYAPRPVERVSYNMIRGSSAGAGWPNSSDVDPTSFLGILQAKSGLALDLPTEAQWEYACRAGTTTALNSGKNLSSTGQDSEMDKVGRYWYNGGSSYTQSCDWSAGTAKVSSYAPNAWGLYDMHGNVWEWCLDWYGSYSGDATDPKGSSSGSYRVVRGGSWYHLAISCRSANRYYDYPSGGYYIIGFRLVRTLSNTAVAEIAARSEAVAATSGGAGVQGESDPVRVDLRTGTRTAAETESITYSTEWVDGAGEGAVAVVSVNGEVISEQMGSGTVEWTPPKNGTHELTHKVMAGGVPVGETLRTTFLAKKPEGGPYKETVDGIEWTFMVDVNLNASVGTGNPGGRAVPFSTKGAVTIPTLLGGCTVTSIGDLAFYDCYGLTGVAIPSGVTSIGDSAFKGCTGVRSVTIPSSVTSIGDCAFSCCVGLTGVTIPEGVTNIGGGAFENCDGLMSVMISSSVTSIGDLAFRDCGALIAINVDANNEAYASQDGVLFNKGKTILLQYPGGKQGVFKIPSSVMNISEYAFGRCAGLTSVTIPSSVMSIGSSAFYACVSLASIAIQEGVTCIGDRAFRNCYALTSMTIPSSVTNIGNEAISCCINLNAVDFEGAPPDGVQNACINQDAAIRYNITYQAQWLPVIQQCGWTNATPYLPQKPEGGPYREAVAGIEWTFMVDVNSNAVVGTGEYWSPAISQSTTGAIAIPAVLGGRNVAKLSNYALYRCSGLTNVTIPEGVTSIGDCAFSECTSLTGVTIPSCVTNIGGHAFNKCSGLTSVAIPAGVTSIGDQAFSECTGLQAIEVDAANNHYSSQGGVLFDKSKTSLIQCPGGKQGTYTVPSSVTSVGDYAFCRCSGLTHVTIPSSVSMIDKAAFLGCDNLNAVDFEGAPPKCVENACIKEDAAIRYNGMYAVQWENVVRQCGWTNARSYYPKGGPYKEVVDGIEWTFMVDADLKASIGTGSEGGSAISTETVGTVSVPEMLGYRIVTGVGAYAFKDCTGLTEVVLPTNIVTIGANAFANDFYLDNVVIPDSVEEIGDGAFMNCTEMISLSLGSGLKKVGSSAFENCISLESVVFQEGLTNLGARAFAAAGATRLKSVSLPVSLEFIGDEAFLNSSYITGVTAPTHLKKMGLLFPSSYQKIESVVIPDGESMIMDAMFQGCSKLTSVIIPVSVTAIGASAFANCSALVELGIPAEVTTLGTRAFYQCQNLETVSLPRKLTAINDETFSGCAQLDSLVIPAEVKTLGSRIYSGLWYYPYTARLTAVNFLGNAPATQSNSYEGMPGALTSHVVNGSTGWYMPGSPTLPPDGWPTVGNARAITYWTPTEFEVTFDGNGGTPETYVSKQITDTTYSLPKSDPVRDGYLFRGWWTAKEAGAQIYWNTRVTAKKAHTLYAHWKALSDTITVIFNPNGGTVEPAQKTYPPGVTFGELPVPTRIGHNFVGWYTAPVGGDLVDEATPVTKENNELYAHWVPITYRVAFDANGGSGSMYSQTHTYNVAQALTANAYYLTGFNFTGWSETRGGVVKYANRAVVENLAEKQDQVVTLYAVWNGAKYSVRFDANGGEGIMANQTHQVGVRLALSKCTFTRKGYSFLGWATTPKGVVEYEDEEEVQNLTMQASATVPLYAVWSPNPYSIAYDANGGTGTMAPTACLYDKEATIPACGFSKSGYSFTGWATSAEGAVVYTPGQKVLNLTDEAGKVITLFAVWELAGVEAPVFSPKDGTVFKGSCTVTLTCPTPGASIYCRIGSKPKATSKYLYSAPFEITETSTVYAFAKLGDTESDCVTATYTKGKIIPFEEAVKAKGITAFTHGGDAVWGVEEGLGEGNVCVRSGVIIDEQVSWFETTVQGSGTISFKWKASCEEDYPSQEWDHLAFNIDGAKDDYARLDGVTDWEEVSVKLEAGTHTLRWSYVKDESDAEGEDCGWVDCVTWTPDVQPIEPGGELDVPKGKTAKEFADEVNKNKAQYLNWPLESPVSTDYLGCFTAVPKGDAKVEFVLNEEGTNQVNEATTAAKTNTLESVLSKSGTLVIGDPLIGFYYSLKQGSDVTVGDMADLNKLAGRDTLSFPLTTDKSKYFYQSLVTPTPVPTK